MKFMKWRLHASCRTAEVLAFVLITPLMLAPVAFASAGEPAAARTTPLFAVGLNAGWYHSKGSETWVSAPTLGPSVAVGAFIAERAVVAVRMAADFGSWQTYGGRYSLEEPGALVVVKGGGLFELHQPGWPLYVGASLDYAHSYDLGDHCDCYDLEGLLNSSGALRTLGLAGHLGRTWPLGGRWRVGPTGTLSVQRSVYYASGTTVQVQVGFAVRYW